MENAIIIEELISIENQANIYIQESENAKKDLPKRITQYIDNLKSVLNEETLDKIAMVKNESSTQLKTKLLEVEKESAEKMRILERDFEVNREKWEDMIFHKVLGTES